MLRNAMVVRINITSKCLAYDRINRLFRSNSSVSSRSSVPLDIINEEDYSVEETGFIDFEKWCIPKVDTKSIYKTN